MLVKLNFLLTFRFHQFFNVSYLYPFRDAGIQPDGVTSDRDDPAIDWKGKIPQKEQPQIESILEK